MENCSHKELFKIEGRELYYCVNCRKIIDRKELSKTHYIVFGEDEKIEIKKLENNILKDMEPKIYHLKQQERNKLY